MPIRDISLTIIIFGLLPVCLARPWIGVLVWSWLGYMNPHRLTWVFAYDMPFAQMVALATIGGILFTKDWYPLPRIREVYLLLALWGIFFLSTLFAIEPDAAWDQFNKVSKILLMTFVTLLLFQDPKKLRLLIWVIALSIGFFGLKGGIWALLTSGEFLLHGPEGSFIMGNTALGLALNMVLPFFLFLRREETRPWLRHLLLAMFCFSIIGVLITYSRGAFLGLAVVLALLFLKGRSKLLVLPLLVAGLFLAPLVVPERWFEKMDTIRTYDEDQSAVGRLRAWQVSYRLALDHPVLGGGFEPFSPELYYRYLPDRLLVTADIGTGAHSIFFQVLAEHGFTGLALYVGLILSTLLSLRRMIRMSRGDPSRRWIYNLAQMLEVSLFGYLVCGIFLSMSYFDLFYHLVVIVVILKKLDLVQAQEAAQASDLATARPAFAAGFSRLKTTGQQLS